MRLRGPLIGVFAIAAVVIVGAFFARPLLAARLGGMIEDRLARETGLRWRIGGLDFDAAPGLVLTDVTVEGEGVSGRLKQIRATGPLGLVFGGGGTVQARIEGASLTVPLALPAGRRKGAGSVASGDGPGVAALRAVVRGGDAALTSDGRALALAAGAADLALDLVPGPAGRDPAIRLELPDRGTVAEVEAAAPEAARRLSLTLAPAGGPRVAATADARLDGAGLRLDRIAGTIDQAPFSGSLGADAGIRGKPQVRADLRLDALALADAQAEMRADAATGITVPVRADLVPDPAWFAGFEGQASFAVQRLALGPVQASGVGLSVRVRDGRLDTSLDGATLYGGSVRGRYVVEPDGRTGRHQIGLTLSNVRVLPLMRDVAGVSGLDGTGSGRLDVQARGATPQALLRSASGQVEVSAVDGRIDGLDLARAAGLTNVGGGIATKLNSLGAHFTVGDGRATTNDMQLKTGLVEAEGVGNLDMVARTIDLRLKPFKVTAGGRLNVPIQISGSWDSPAVSADFAGLAQDPASTLQGLQNLGSSILGGRGDAPGGGSGGRDGGLGEGLGGLLEGLMGGRQGGAPRRR